MMVNLVNHLFGDAVLHAVASDATGNAIARNVSDVVVHSIDPGVSVLPVVEVVAVFAAGCRAAVEAIAGSQRPKIPLAQAKLHPAPLRIKDVSAIQGIKRGLTFGDTAVGVAGMCSAVSLEGEAAAGLRCSLLKAASAHRFHGPAVAATLIEILVPVLLPREGENREEAVPTADLAVNRGLSDHPLILPQSNRCNKGTAFEPRIHEGVIA
jgi:hypothetical protein